MLWDKLYANPDGETQGQVAQLSWLRNGENFISV